MILRVVSLQHVLVGAVRDGEPPPGPLSARRAGRLAAFAAFQRVGAWLWLTWRNHPDLDPELGSMLRTQWSLAAGEQLRIGAALRQVSEALRDVPWLVIKGPALAELAYPRPDMRAYSDLDVLVPDSAIDDSVRVLDAAGFSPIGRDLAYARRHDEGQLSMQSPMGVALDLHWELVKDRRMRELFILPTAALMDRAREVTVCGQAVKTLDPSDTLLHVALHACMNGVQRLGWVNDVHQVVTSNQPDWSEVVARANGWGTSRPVGAMLARSRRILRTQIPDDVLLHLDPGRTWQVIDQAISLVSGVPSGRFQRAVSRTHNRAAVAGPGFALAEAAAITGRRLAGRGLVAPDDPVGPSVSPGDG